MADIEKYMERLEELIKDEDKIVSVSTFARDQGIAIINARVTFDKFVEENKNFGVTYILSGILKNGTSKGVYLLKDVDLDKSKDIFESEPKKNIHSIQKSINVDYNVIALVDKFSEANIHENPLLGSVVGKNCVKREIKRKILPPPPVNAIKGKSSFFIKPKPDETVKNDQKEEKIVEAGKTEAKPKTQNNIANMFSKATTSNKQSSKPEKVSSDVKNSKQPNGLAGFLSRNNSSSSNGDNKKNAIKIEERSSSESKKITSSENSESLVNSEDFEELMDCEEVEKPLVEKEDKKDKKKKKRIRSRSKEKSTKRRKRIVEINDSDSDDIFASEKESEDTIEKSDEEITPPSPVTKKPLAPKNKRRKAIERTYEDEEGFILTKTEYVYETPSEDESEHIKEEPKKEEPKKEPPKKIEKKNSNSENEVSPKKGTKKNKKEPGKNQPTLMNFFKKK